MYLITLLLALSSTGRSGDDSEGRELIKRIQSGDVDALDVFYDRYAPLLFGLILTILQKRSEAEDVLQEVFVMIWEKAHSYNPDKGNVSSWVVTIARNKAIDRTRSREYKTQIRESGNIENFIGITALDDPDPIENMARLERIELVRNALKKIPNEQRKVIEVAYFSGFSQSEIADAMDLPLGTVKSRMRQGMIKLRDLLRTYF